MRSVASIIVVIVAMAALAFVLSGLICLGLWLFDPATHPASSLNPATEIHTLRLPAPSSSTFLDMGVLSTEADLDEHVGICDLWEREYGRLVMIVLPIQAEPP